MPSNERSCVFLRAINTGGRRLTNDEVLAPFHVAGFSDVAAYQAAGNIVLRADPGALDHRVLDPLVAAAYGFDAPSFVRTFGQLDSLIAGQPFDEREVASTEGRIQVAFLRDAPSQEIIDAIADVVPDDEVVRIDGNTLYWLPLEGISGSKLPVGQVEKLTGPMTIRTLGTIERIVKKFTD